MAPSDYINVGGHKLGGGFRVFYERNGGLVAFGFPLSGEYNSPLLGGRRIQPFQGIVLVYQPNTPAPWDITRVLIDEIAPIWGKLKEEAARLGR